jgi:fatty-acyl-CoA synthase
MPYRDLTVEALLRALARDLPSQEALVTSTARWTFAELDHRADIVARSLINAGLRKGDRAAVWATNRPEWVLLQFALARAGMILVTVNTLLKAHEVEYLLRQSQANALFLISGFRDVNYVESFRGMAELSDLRHVFFLEEGTPPPGMRSFHELEADSPEVAFEPQDVDEVINMQYTSGTTGFPKGVMLTHRNIVNNGHAIGTVLHYTAADRVCVPVPLFHCFGCVIGVMGAYTHGASIALIESFDPLQVLETIHRERCTSIYGVPTMFLAELEHAEFSRFDLTSLRTGVMAGSLCPVSLMQRVTSDMHVPEITICYGLTEASPVITQTRPDDPFEKRVTTVGTPLPGVEVRLVDPATLQDAAEGELWSRGYHIMKGYYRDPEATSRAITPDGWLRSGDLASRDADGYYSITGRLKELIIRGGENIAPKEIEEVLRTHPAVSDAAVFGVPDERFGEEVVAAIRLKPGASAEQEEIRDYVRARLARFKVPRYVEVVECFPQTASGKIQRFRLREMWSHRE